MDTYTDTLLPWIPALPLLAALLTALLGPKVLRSHSHWPTLAGLTLSWLLSVLLLIGVGQKQRRAEEGGFEQVVVLWNWADVAQAYDYEAQSEHAARGAAELGDFSIDVALRSDGLTAMMLCMVTFISTLVAIFSVGYMRGDRGYWRFFSYIGLFVFSMTMLVSVSNFVLLFVFWEAVGVCSYLLIGFWYTKQEAAAAGKKAFLVNRVGDFGFTLAIFLIWTTFGTLNYHDTPIGQRTEASAASPQTETLPGVLGKTRIAKDDFYREPYGREKLLAICLLLLLGACGKSAQFPLQIWLPDAMEGPTPVSALIHAATMVTAGVYMIARCTPLFAASPDAQIIVAIIGALTALLAGLIAMTQFDLKRVLAYSTISQLGYMFVGLGVGTLAGVTAGMFHLFTHAFFKALLFLGAGSVMHAMGNVIDMRRFGGLRRLLPITYWTFLIGCVALAGIPPFSGFWSKDAIVASVHDKAHELAHEPAHGAERQTPAAADHREQGHREQDVSSASHSLLGMTSGQQARVYEAIYYCALFTALLTSFYTFRAFLMTFHGAERVPEEANGHAHESPPLMTGPLCVLAIFAALVGLALDWTPWASPGEGQHPFARYIVGAPSLADGAIAATAGLDRFHVSVAATSSVIALVGLGLALFCYGPSPAPLARRIWARLERPLLPSISTASLRDLSLNKFYMDEIYEAVIVRPLRRLADGLYLFDRHVIDGLVNSCGQLPRALGGLLRTLQMGLVQFYGLAMVLVVVVVLAARLIWASG